MNELAKFSQDAGEFFGQIVCAGIWLMVVMILATIHLIVWAVSWIIRVLS